MAKSKRQKLLAAMAAIVCLSMLLFSACSEKAGGNRGVNLVPKTFIAFGPVEDSLTYYKVQVFWYGADEDGDIDRFQVTTLKGIDRDDFPPGFDWGALEGWGETTSKESTFVLPADSCCLEVGRSRSALSLWGILVRAVDNEGAISDQPAMVFFKANNAVPKVSITVPERLPIDYIDVPPHPYIEWEGEDPDGDVSELRYKYLIIPERDLNPRYPFLPPLDRDSTGGGHAAPPVGYWSEWVPADCTFVTDLDLSLYKGTLEKIMVFVTVKDEGQAVLPENLYGSYNGSNNFVRLLIVPTGAGVTCIIDGAALGRRSSMRVSDYKGNIAGAFLGTPVNFRFWGEEEKARGEIANAYRYYWDSPEDPNSAWNYWTGTAPIREPGSTPEWFVRYPLDGSRIEPSLGRHVLVVELRDLNKVETHCEFHLEILEGPRRAAEKKILLVDDDRAFWLEPWWQGYEDEQDALWREILDGYNWEEFDTGKNYDDELPIRFVDIATTVIWVVDADFEQPGTHLLEVCSELGNYLYSYVKVGGNLIVLGADPVYACGYWPDGTPTPDRRGSYAAWDFRPQWRSAEQESVYNWMWDVFGIEKMALASPPFPFTAIWSCGICSPAFRDTIELGPQAGRIYDAIGNAYYITNLREDFDVIPLYSTARKSVGGDWVDSGNSRLIAVYAPGRGTRGHAAYVGFPEYWFDHDKIKTFVRRLLDEFGEEPLGS
jgi:hypothetical protein